MDATANEPKSWILLAAVGLFFVGLAALAPVPAQVAPYSFLTVIPAFLIAGVVGQSGLVVGAVLGSVISPVVFLVFARRVQKTGRALPKSSLITFAVLAALSLAYAATGWNMTVRYTSVLRATALVTQALLPILLIAATGFAMRKNLTMRQSLVLHWFTCAWLAWSAFPWHGELL